MTPVRTDGFRDERLAQREPVAGRATVSDPSVRAHVVLRLAHFADSDKLPMPFIERADLVLHCGEKPSLNTVPQFAKCASSVRGRHVPVLHCD